MFSPSLSAFVMVCSRKNGFHALHFMPQEPTCDDASCKKIITVCIMYFYILVYHLQRPKSVSAKASARCSPGFLLRDPGSSSFNLRIMSEIQAENDFPFWLRA